MEAIAAFSLACNVIQVVDFGLKVASMCQATYKTGQVRPELQDVTTEFRAAYSLLQERPPAQNGTTPEDQAMIDLGRKCDESAGRLLARLSKLEGPRGQKIRALGRTVKVLWESSKIDELQKQFESYRRVLETRILVDIRHQHNLNAIKQSEGFDHLGEAVQRLIIKLGNGETRLDALVTNQHNETRGLIVSKIDELRIDIKDNIDHKEVLKSLHFPEMVSRQENISDTYANTFEWILDPPEEIQNASEDSKNHPPVEILKRPHPSLLEWLKTGNGVYWICGKAGSGKSTLMRYICEDKRTMLALRNSSKSSETLVIEYFFWNPGSKLQKSIIGLLRVILFQLVKSEPVLGQLCVTESGVISAWTEKRLTNLVILMAAQKAKTTDLCIFVDGLDEVDGDLDRLLALIHTISQIPNVKCVVSSRPWRVFHVSFDGRPQLHLQDLTQKDIKIFVEGKLEEIQSLFTSREIAKLVSTISRNADGVFLWVTLATASVLDGIRNGDNYLELSARLEELPKELNDLYDTLLSRIRPQYRTQAIRYFQLLLLDAFVSLEFSVLVLSFVDLKLPQLSENPSRDATSDTEYQDAIIGRCNQTMIHLLQRCGGLLHLHFTDKPNLNQIPGIEVTKERHQIPAQVKSLAEADALRIDFLHRTVFDYIRQLIAPVPDPRSIAHLKDPTAFWHPAIARAEAAVRKIPVMCEAYRDRRKVGATVLEGNGRGINLIPETEQLSVALVAIANAEQSTSIPPDDLLIEIDNQGTKLMGLVVETFNLEHGFCWSKLLVSSSENFGRQVLSSQLELYNYMGLDNFVVQSLISLSPEDCKQESTKLLPGALCSLTFLSCYKSHFSYLIVTYHEVSLSLESRARIVMALLNIGADPNSTMEDNEVFFIQSRHSAHSTISKAPIQLTPWSFLLTMLTYDFYVGRVGVRGSMSWHKRHHLDLWRDIITVFVERGANVQAIIANLVVTILGSKTVSDCAQFFEFEFAFIFDSGVLPILKSYFFDEKAGRELIETLQSSNVSSNIRIKCLQLNIYTPPRSNQPESQTQRSVTIENMALLLGLSKEAAVFGEQFEIERLHPRGMIFSWEVSGMLDHLGSDIMRANRPLWAQDEEEYSSLWDPAGGNVILPNDPLDEPSETPSSLPQVLKDVMEILNQAAESGHLEQSEDFCYYNRGWI